MPFHIAIDGPVASGKGTVARLVAQRLGVLYIDTGAMYRATALLASRNGVSLENEPEIVQLLTKSSLELRQPTPEEQDGRLITVLLNGEDISWAIRTEEMSQGASKVGVFPQVRSTLVTLQQKIAKEHDVVMEGRDITYRVLPEAQLKIFLTASVESRAKRRHLDAQHRGLDITYAEIHKEIEIRDERDSQRTTDPLQVVEGAWVVDTTDLTIEEVVELIVERAESLHTFQH